VHPGIPKEFFIPMKRSIIIAFALASGFSLSLAAQSLPAAAPAAAPSGPARIAVVSFQTAVAKTNEGQRNYADLEKKYGPREAQLKALNDEIENLTKQLQAQGANLSDSERAGRAKTIDEKKKQLQRSSEDLKNDGNQEIQEMYNTLASKVYEVMSSYAQQQGYTLVLDISQQQSPVLYALPSTEITNAVVDAYNVKSGVPAPAAQPAGAAPKPASRPAAPAAKPAAH
jgi:outer membrane protein